MDGQKDERTGKLAAVQNVVIVTSCHKRLVQTHPVSCMEIVLSVLAIPGLKTREKKQHLTVICISVD